MKTIFYASIGIVLFSIFFVAAECSAVCLNPPSGLVSWWPGDGNALDIIGPNHGTPVNGTTFTPGMVDQAFSFDGVDDEVQAAGTGFADLQQLTIDSWVKHSSLPPGQIQRYVTLANKAVLRFDGGAGPQQLHFYMTINGMLRHIRVNNVLQVGIFHHVAGTYDGSVMRLYLDGGEVGSLAVSGTVSPAPWVAFGSAGEPFDGLLDEVEIFNRALSASEIQAIFNAGTDGKCKTPSGSISGRVTVVAGAPIEDLYVQAWAGPCWDTELGGTFTDEKGNYTLSGLPAGNVYVTTCAGCNNRNYIDEWWDGADGTTVCESAVPVVVPEGSTREDINFNLDTGPKRLTSFEVAVYDGKLDAWFDVHQGFENLLACATLTGPNGFSYEFDLKSDLLEWLTECSYLIGWTHTFGSEFDYGEYTLKLLFSDRARETYTRKLQKTEPTPVNSSSMSYTVDSDGSIDFYWTPPLANQYYQIRVHSADGRTRFFRSGILTTETHLRVPPDNLRCLEKGQNYLWQVRAYDKLWPSYHAAERGQNLPLEYNSALSGDRVSRVDVASSNDRLGVGFDVRPGSRNHISTASVTGPAGFSYPFDLTNDWYDISTETRRNRGWRKTFPPPIVFGTYNFEIRFSDSHTETPSKTLVDVAISVPDTETLAHTIFEDGAMLFSWINPAGAVGQSYFVKVRNVDQSKEYHSSDKVTDESEIFSGFWDLRALEQGRMYQWFVLATDPGRQTTEQSGSLSFIYDPFNLPIECRCDLNGDKKVDDSDLTIFAADFGRTNCNVGASCEGDLEGNLCVDGQDLAGFVAEFGKSDCPACP